MENLKIVIPSTKRADNQLTFNAIPKKFHKYTSICVYSDETEEYIAKNPGARIVGVDRREVNGIAEKREFIAKHCNGKLLFMLDDDLGFIKAKRDGLSGDNGPFLKFEAMEDKDFDMMFRDIDTLCDLGFRVGGLGQRVAPTGIASYPFTINSRVWTNTWFDFRPNLHNPEQYDWTGKWMNISDDMFIPEDFHIQAQVAEEGYPIVSLSKWNVNGNKTQASGGCATSRTIDSHNAGMEEFARFWNQRWDNCVKLRYKDSWEKGKQKAAMTLYLSKIWKQNMGNMSHLMDPWLTRENDCRVLLGGYRKNLAKVYEKQADLKRKEEQQNG